MVEVMAETIQRPPITLNNVIASTYTSKRIITYCMMDTSNRLMINILCHEQNLNLFDKFIMYRSSIAECPNNTSLPKVSTENIPMRITNIRYKFSNIGINFVNNTVVFIVISLHLVSYDSCH